MATASSRAGLLVALAALAAGAPARAYEVNEQLELFGYSQFWVTAYEQMEDARGLYQNPSRDEATDSTTGFSLARVRLGLRLSAPRLPVSLFTQVKLEREFGLLDLSVRFAPRGWLALEVGQMKVPGTFEALTSDTELDFITRAALSTALADYSLSRSAHKASLLYGSNSNLRDLGAAARGEIPLGPAALRYFAFVGNGLGANLYFGGATRKEYFITNGPQLYQGLRLELSDAARHLVLGGHASRNRHDNIVFNSGRVVYDLDRLSGSADLRASLPRAGLRAAALWGVGELRDDFNGDGRTDLRYSGWAAWAVWDLLPALAGPGWSPPYARALELALRAESFVSEIDQAGERTRQTSWTIGSNLALTEFLRLQLNYVLKRTDSPSLPDLDDDILFANLQGKF